MFRILAAIAFGMITLPNLGKAADEPVPGNYKFSIPNPKNNTKARWLLKFDSKASKWSGTVLDVAEEELPRGSVEDVRIENGLLHFNFRINPAIVFHFEGRFDDVQERRILGSINSKGLVQPAFLEPTNLASFDPFEVNKEILTQPSTTQEVVQAAVQLLDKATEKKAKLEEVRAWAERATKASEKHGPTWHREIILDIAEILSTQDSFTSVALQYARLAESLISEKDPALIRKKVLTVLATTLEKSGKIDEAREVQARNNKIAYITVKKFPGRSSKSDRAVLVEMFTCAQSPLCVASELTFDALQQTYKPTEVVLLQYHLHIPGPDPLTNLDGVERQKQYGFQAAPSTFFNGKPLAPGGGPAEIAQANYERYQKVIGPMLEKAARASIKLAASQRGNKVEVRADISDLEDTGENVRLYLVLAEEVVAYTGGNKMATHQLVVRTFPGGASGTVIGKKDFTRKLTVDLESVRQKQTEYLEKYAKDNPFPNKERPMEMKKLRLVAFIQNEDTKEVYQAAQIPVEGE